MGRFYGRVLVFHTLPSPRPPRSVLQPVDPNARSKLRRLEAQRRRDKQRLVAAGALLALIAAGVAGGVIATHVHGHKTVRAAVRSAKPKPQGLQPRPLPEEVRGVHVTMALAGSPGKLEEFIAMQDGGVNSAGLGWTNPYDRRVWKYNVDIAEQAARLGFDEIQFDYVRFPSDGDISQIRYPGVHSQPMGWTIPLFLKYARSRLKPLGVRISVDVFGLSATRDLGIAQFPRRIAPFVDTIYPMVYPSHYVSGEYNIIDPDSRPGTTVAYSLRDFRSKLTGRKAMLIPWLQDFSLGRRYTLADVQDQIQAARLEHVKGFMLWNARGVYTVKALSTQPF